MAHDFPQIEDLDYHDTYSPIAKLVIVRCLLGVVVSKVWELYQLEVNTTFLYGDLFEEVYMFLQPGYKTSTFGKFVTYESLYMAFAKHLVIGTSNLVEFLLNTDLFNH